MNLTALPVVFTAKQYIQIFPIKTLTHLSISNLPKHKIVRLKSKGLANISSVFSTLLSGTTIWTNILQTDAEFFHLHGTAWLTHIEPNYPNHTQWISIHIVNQYLRTFNIELRQNMEHINIKDAIRIPMLEAIPKNLIDGLKDPINLFNRRLEHVYVLIWNLSQTVYFGSNDSKYKTNKIKYIEPHFE